MSHNIPGKVVEAIAHIWGFTHDLANRFTFEELVHDWVVWEHFKIETSELNAYQHHEDSDEPCETTYIQNPMEAFKTAQLGASLLIIPKQGKNYFFISSGDAVGDDTGVSYDYEIIIHECPKPSREAAQILADHINLSTFEVLKALKQAPEYLGVHYISYPLRLIRALKNHNIKLSLLRPGDKGGYQSDTVF